MSLFQQVAAPPPYPLSAEVRAYVAIFVWPIFAAIVLFVFRNTIRQAVSSGRKVIVKVLGTEIELSEGEASSALNDVFREIDLVLTQKVTAKSKDLFVTILAYPAPPKVSDVIPGFERGSDAHTNLGILRSAYFIRPVEGGRWQSQKHIEVTTLGRIVEKHRFAVLNEAPRDAVRSST
jgi:hypothetical protein